METFKAIVVDKPDGTYKAEIREMREAELMDGDVTVRVEHTTVNYKDGLAVTGKAPVVRRFPLVPGIDLAGTVTASSHAGFSEGDRVVLNGWGIGETHHGAYAGRARVKGDWLVPLPEGMSGREAMAIGTAGYTAMLCVMALERHAIVPERGPIVVTGASGGVGSVAVALLSKLGYEVIAATGRQKEAGYLKKLGAKEVIDRAELSDKAKPLARERWAGGIDTAGGNILANLLAMTRYGGAVACCGLAAGMDLPTSVAPFILRGVSLLGVDSVMAPQSIRREAWSRLAQDLDKAKLETVATEAAFEDIPRIAGEILDGKVRGRVVVKVPG